MVHELRRAEERRVAMVAADIEAVVRAVPGIPVKVILETAALTDEEKILACRLARRCGRRVRQDVDRLPSGGRRHGRRCAPDARRRRSRHGRQGFGRHSQPRRCARDARRGREPHRNVRERGDSRCASPGLTSTRPCCRRGRPSRAPTTPTSERRETECCRGPSSRFGRPFIMARVIVARLASSFVALPVAAILHLASAELAGRLRRGHDPVQHFLLARRSP